MTNNSQSLKITIWVASITVVGTLGTAFFNNWDKIFYKPANLPVTSQSGVAIVFDPPSNVRSTPNGKIICSIRERTKINIDSSLEDDWYYTDVCGVKGFIHNSQITFKTN